MKNMMFRFSALLLLIWTAGCQDQLVAPEASSEATSLSSAQAQLHAAAAQELSAERTRLEVRLSATAEDPLASGTAKFESRSTTRKTFSTEVEDVSTSGPGTVVVSRAGTTLMEATINIDGVGFGDLNMRGAAVADLLEGDLVEVFNAGGTRILSGTLAVK